MKKISILFTVAIILAFAMNSQAVTIIEKLTPSSPTVRIEEPNSGCSFGYSAEGYTECTVLRKIGPAEVGAYYIPLDKSYFLPDKNGVSTVNDVWFGFDFKYYSSSAGGAFANIGLFNSDANNVDLSPGRYNSIDLTPANKANFYIGSNVNNTSTGARQISDVLSQVSLNTTDSYRCRVHAYISGGQTLVDLKVYTVDVSNLTTLINTDTAYVVAAATQSFWTGLNAIGVRNVMGSDNTGKSIFSVDNFYFSTAAEVADVNLGAPGWLKPDDPANLIAGAFTNTQDFRPAPATWQSIAQVQSGSGFGADPNGYVYCEARRKSGADSVAAYYMKLPTRFYEPFNYHALKFWSSEEFWMGFDYKYISGSTGATAQISLFNSSASNNTIGYNKQNCITIEPAGTNIYMRNTTNKTGNTLAQNEPLIGTISDLNGSYRFKMRVYREAPDVNTTKVDVTCYGFDAQGNVNVAYEFTNTVTLVGAADPNYFFEGMDAFGVRNISMSTAGGPTVFLLDNMYFSTQQAPSTMDKPSWFCLNRADFNCDNKVDMLDLKLVAQEWLSTTLLEADMNNSGRVDFADFATFASYWMTK